MARKLLTFFFLGNVFSSRLYIFIHFPIPTVIVSLNIYFFFHTRFIHRMNVTCRCRTNFSFIFPKLNIILYQWHGNPKIFY